MVGIEEMEKDNMNDLDDISREEYLIYNSLNPHISIQLFVEQLISHLLFPISLPFFIRKYGYTFPLAHGFLPKSFPSLLSNWLFPSFFLLVLVTSRYLPSQIGSGYAVPACIFLIHRFMVATKYATLSESEYAKYLDLNRPGGRFAAPRPDYDKKLASYQTQLQVILGWLHLSPETISYELHAAARKLDIDLEHLFFYVPIPPSTTPGSNEIQMSREQFSISYQYDLWKLFLKQDDLLSKFPRITIPTPLQSMEYLCIDSCTFCESILDLCNWSFSARFKVTPLIISLVFAFIPIIFIFIYPSQYSLKAIPSGSYHLYILYHISSFMINSLLFNALVMILCVCIMDAYRKYHIFMLLSSLVRPNDVDTDTLHISTARSKTHFSASIDTNSFSKKMSSVSPANPIHQNSRTNRRSSILLPSHDALYPHSSPVKSSTPVVEYNPISSIEEEEQEEVYVSNEEKSQRLQEIQKPEEVKLKKQKSTFASRRAKYTFKAYAANDTRSIIPKLDFEIQNNIFSWSSVRLVFHNFGERMKLRIDCYLVVIFCFMLIFND